MATKNNEQEHYFIGGMKRDNANQAEDPKTYFFGLNGRLYSDNGKLSFSSIEGTIEVWNDSRILKYLGYCAFKDELVLMVKVQNIGEFGIEIDDDDYTDTTYPPNQGPGTGNPQAVDYSDLYELVNDGFYGQICDSGSGPINPVGDVLDGFVALSKDPNGNIIGRWLWVGNLGWHEDAKICTVGMHENNSFKRIYFTDFLNTFRVVNILNGRIESLNSSQFNVFQEFSLSQPLIDETITGGFLKSGINFYTYRLISNDGQRTTFSDLSERVVIHPGTTGQDIRGGDVSEETGKRVKIRIINEDTHIYDKIEVVAIVYEAEGAPTSVKSIGVQDLNNVNIFYHSGNEPGYDLNITLLDVTERSGGWRYCSDLRTEKNKLIASGLRNTPIPYALEDLGKDFMLRGFDASGSTFYDSFINPKPKKYRFIPKNGQIGSYRKLETIIKMIKVFGTFTFTIRYQNTEFTETFVMPPTYNNVTELIWIFISQHVASFPGFNFTYLNEDIILAPANSSFNLDDLEFVFSTNEVSIDSHHDYQHIPVNLSGEMIHGAQSYGFEHGNGIRITFSPEYQDLIELAGPFTKPIGNSAQSYPSGNGDPDTSFHMLWDAPFLPSTADNFYEFNRQNLFNLKPNSLKRGLFKGDIYRVGLQFERSGETLFTLPIGDFMVPEIGDPVKTLESQEINTWANSRVKGDVMQSILTNLIVDIRLNCDVRDVYTSVKLVYVQRTPENRTIICQGLSAPLVRHNNFSSGTTINYVPPIANKWTLPFMGGPGIDHMGVSDTATYGENMTGTVGERGRTIVHRSLMYFDSPEILFDRIPESLIMNTKAQVVAKVWGDHEGSKFLGHGLFHEQAVSFSQKIHSTTPVWGRNAMPGITFNNPHGLVGNPRTLPNWVNVTIFANASYITNKQSHNIQTSKIMAKGEIIGGGSFNAGFEISNNAMTLFQPVNYYSGADRYPTVSSGNTNFEGWKTNRHCVGARTLIMKTETPIFHYGFFDDLGAGTHVAGVNNEGMGFAILPFGAFVKHALINIVADNEDSVYGGRSELAYAANVFIPLSKTIPIPKDSNRTMRLNVSGDTYCSLFFNNKTQYADYPEATMRVKHSGGGCNNNDKRRDYDEIYLRTAAWGYGVVIESTVDVALAKGLKFYQNSGAVDMTLTTDSINEVYFQEGNLRSYIAKPVDFRDDPDLLHVVAVSDTKIMGSPLDSWTSFRVNNFYELEKNKGGAYNLAKSLDDIYAIQENQTSRLYLNERGAAMNTSDGAIMLKTGTGTGIDGHKVISDYGTAIRRSVTEIISSMEGAAGFYFFDEEKKELVKIAEGKLVKEDLAYYVNTLLGDNKVYDVEGYYDDLNKETVVRTRTEDGQYLTFSYNELFGVMNGFFDYNNDQYFIWNNEVFQPKLGSSIVEQINKGIHLKISGEYKKLKIGVITNISPTAVKIFHNFMANINIDYNIDQIDIKTSSGQTRTILGTHKRYRIREGVHTVPLKNEDDWADLRGEWMELTITISNLSNKKIDIFSITNFIRESYI